MAKQKIIRIKVGEIFVNGKYEGVWQTYWRKESKKGGIYYEARILAFPSEITIKEKENIEEIKIRDI